MSGAFDSPLGSTPFGAGTPLPAGAPPTGLSTFVRFIDGVTGDFQQDAATGHLAQMPLVRQRVFLALVTRLGSSSVLPGFGLKRPTKIDNSIVRTMQAAARVALYQLTDVEKVVRIDDLIVEQVTSGRVQLTVLYTDLSTGNPDKVTV